MYWGKSCCPDMNFFKLPKVESKRMQRPIWMPTNWRICTETGSEAVCGNYLIWSISIKMHATKEHDLPVEKWIDKQAFQRIFFQLVRRSDYFCSFFFMSIFFMNTARMLLPENHSHVCHFTGKWFQSKWYLQNINNQVFRGLFSYFFRCKHYSLKPDKMKKSPHFLWAVSLIYSASAFAQIGGIEDSVSDISDTIRAIFQSFWEAFS